MDCTLKIIAGPDAGQEFHANGEQTVIGRSPHCAIRLNHPSISYEHAMISRSGDEYFVENLSAGGTFLNNDRLAARTRLRTKDQIRLGAETVVRVESLPAASSGSASGSSRRMLLVMVVVMLLVAAAVVVIDPFSGSSTSDWPRAYAVLQQYVQEAAAEGQLPADAPAFFREAWRLESAGDRANAGKAWLRLRVLLDDADEKSGNRVTSRQSFAALEKVLDPAHAALPSEELHAALPEFVKQMERRK